MNAQGNLINCPDGHPFRQQDIYFSTLSIIQSVSCPDSNAVGFPGNSDLNVRDSPSLHCHSGAKAKRFLGGGEIFQRPA